MRFTIKQKLASIFAAIILLSGIAAWVGTKSLSSLDDSVKAPAAEAARKSRLVERAIFSPRGSVR